VEIQITAEAQRRRGFVVLLRVLAVKIRALRFLRYLVVQKVVGTGGLPD
jgi:hypothetical protein